MMNRFKTFVFCCSMIASTFAQHFTIAQIKQMAKAGIPMYQNTLAKMYLHGSGVSKNYKKSLYWTMRAIHEGDRVAKANLGFYYLGGYGVKVDFKKALQYLNFGLEQNDSYAINSLGTMYQEGDGVKQDLKKAIYYYVKSSNLGNPVAQFNLGRLLLHNRPHKAYLFYLASAKGGLIQGLRKVAFMDEFGIGTEKSYAKACKWFSLGARKHDKISMNGLTALTPKMSEAQKEECRQLVQQFRMRPSTG
jgi:uncharacterized protein